MAALFSPRFVKTHPTSRTGLPVGGFSLVEIVAGMAVIALLLTAGIYALGSTGGQARQVATTTVVGMLEQARTSAITSHCVVVLAVAEPGEYPSNDHRCRLGLFKIHEWPAKPATLDGIPLGHWQSLPVGVIILPGSVSGLRNPRDEPAITIRYLAANQATSGLFFLLAFSPRGSLLWPSGADPLALRIAEGSYRNGQPTPNTRSRSGGIAESHLQIGRITARPYQFDK